MIIIRKIRYVLRKGKYGCYFHDNEIMIDLTLEMVLNRLNLCENNRTKQLSSIKNLKKVIFDLTNKIFDLKKKLELFNQ